MNSRQALLSGRPSKRARVVGWIGILVGALFVVSGVVTLAELVVDGPTPSTPRPICVTHDADGTSVANVGLDCDEVARRQ